MRDPSPSFARNPQPARTLKGVRAWRAGILP